jgi:hypothetical protein
MSELANQISRHKAETSSHQFKYAKTSRDPAPPFSTQQIAPANGTYNNMFLATSASTTSLGGQWKTAMGLPSPATSAIVGVGGGAGNGMNHRV